MRTRAADVVEMEMDMRPMTRGGPSWGKEKPRFKLKTPVVAPATPVPPVTEPEAPKAEK